MPAMIVDAQHQAVVGDHKTPVGPTAVPRLPPELIRSIMMMNKDNKGALANSACANSTFNLHATPFLYNTVTFADPYAFTKYANAVDGPLGPSSLVRHLDLSSFTTLGMHKSAAHFENVVTPDTLIRILKASPNLETVSIAQSVENAITTDVLRVLLLECRNIKSVDFTSCVSKQFATAMKGLATELGPVEIVRDGDDDTSIRFRPITHPRLAHIRRLSFYECALEEFSTILPLLANAPNLTHLDFGGCSISDLTLIFLATQTNATATLTHLSLARCKSISSEGVAEFVTKCSNLTHLNLFGDVGKINEYDLITIVSSPAARRLHTLDIGASQITSRVLYALEENCSVSLRHLGIANAEIASISILNGFVAAMPELRYLDLSNVRILNAMSANGFVANLNKLNHNLHTIEMSESLLKKLRVPGWYIANPFGRRLYYAREAPCGVLRPDHVHARKLDLASAGPERISKIYHHYAYCV